MTDLKTTVEIAGQGTLTAELDRIKSRIAGIKREMSDLGKVKGIKIDAETLASYDALAKKVKAAQDFRPYSDKTTKFIKADIAAGRNLAKMYKDTGKSIDDLNKKFQKNPKSPFSKNDRDLVRTWNSVRRIISETQSEQIKKAKQLGSLEVEHQAVLARMQLGSARSASRMEDERLRAARAANLIASRGVTAKTAAEKATDRAAARQQRAIEKADREKFAALRRGMSLKVNSGKLEETQAKSVERSIAKQESLRAKASAAFWKDIKARGAIRERSHKAEMAEALKVEKARVKGVAEHEKARAKMRSSMGHNIMGIGSNAKHAVTGLSHPFFTSPAFVAMAGLTSALFALQHVIEKAAPVDKAATEMRIRGFAPGTDRATIATVTEQRRERAIRDAMRFGGGAEHIMGIEANSIREGVDPKIAKDLPAMIMKFAQSTGLQPEEATEHVSKMITQETAMGNIHNSGDARKMLNNLASMSNQFGMTPQMMMQFLDSGGMGHGAQLGYTPSQTLGMANVFGSGGARTGMYDARMLGSMAEIIPSLKDKWMASVESNGHSDADNSMRKMPQTLGYGNIFSMQARLKTGGPEAMLELVNKLGKLPLDQRQILLRGMGFSEQAGAVFAEIANDKDHKAQKIMKTSQEAHDELGQIHQRPGGRKDYLTRQADEFKTGWMFIQSQFTEGADGLFAEVFQALKTKVLMPASKIWVTFVSQILNHGFKQKIESGISAFINGLGFRDIAQALLAMKNSIGSFDPAPILKGVGEGIRALFDDLKWAFDKLGVFAGTTDPEKIAKIATELMGLALASMLLAPVIGIIGSLASVLGLFASLAGLATNVAGFATVTAGLKAFAAIEIGGTALGLLRFAGAIGVVAAAVEGLLKLGVLNRIEIPHDMKAQSWKDFVWGKNKDGSSAMPEWAGGATRQNQSYEGDGGYANLLHNTSYDEGDIRNDGSGEEIKSSLFGTERAVQGILDEIRRGGSFATKSGFVGANSFGAGTVEAGGGSAGGRPNMRYGRSSDGATRGTPGSGSVPMGTPGAGGSRSWRNNNPGNIEYGAFAKSMGATGSDGRFAIFPSYEGGRAAQSKLLFESKTYKDLTLGQAINKWAPASENNVGAYLSAMGGNPNAKMSSFSPEQRGKLLDAMQAHEGWKVGTRKAGGPTDMSSIPGGGGSVGAAVDHAMSLQGAGEAATARALGKHMSSGQWCADFVNGVFAKNGVQGTGSSMANSFNKWGHLVDPHDPRKGDVITENRGGNTPTHHVGIATGEVHRNKAGVVDSIGMISGNYGHQVRHNMERLSIVQGLHRGAEDLPTASRLPPVHHTRPGGGQASVTVHAPINVHHSDPQHVASIVGKHIDSKMSQHTSDVDFDV